MKLKEKLSVDKKSFLEPYDVLLSTIGNFDKVSIFPTDMKGNWIYHQSIFRIRFKENQQDNAVAFVMFLMSHAGKAVIEKIQVGSKVKSISKKSLSVIKIPRFTPDIKKQSRTLFNKEIKMIQKIVELSASIEELRNSYLKKLE